MSGILHALVEDAAREAGCQPEQMLGRINHITINLPHPRAKLRIKAYLKAKDAGFSYEQIARVFKVTKKTVVEATREARFK
jgi:DNA-directed RNA polymerase specialized sigma24 family protein